MAVRRMFSLSIVDTDRFMDMPTSAQALYFHLGMHGDDDGFVGSPKKIMRSVGCNDDDLRILAQKGFIIPFQSGVVVIVDWKQHNYLRGDRYHPTIYTEEKQQLEVGESGKYVLISGVESVGIPNGNQMATQYRLGEVSLEKGEGREATHPALETVISLFEQNGASRKSAEKFFNHFTSVGWVDAQNRPIMSWSARAAQWIAEDAAKEEPEQPQIELYIGEDGKCHKRK